ncbi:MAG: hypothetical protein OQL06_10955 [Gammaproteobacteria bacterium]|nr:hypothetical protein [Gammaproteobacteria bacterium]
MKYRLKAIHNDEWLINETHPNRDTAYDAAIKFIEKNMDEKLRNDFVDTSYLASTASIHDEQDDIDLIMEPAHHESMRKSGYILVNGTWTLK